MAALLVLGLAGCGGNGADQQRLQQEQLARARAEGARQARMEERTKEAARTTRELRRELSALRKRRDQQSEGTGGQRASTAGATTATRLVSGTGCGSGVSVNSVTTCSFAANVRSAYYGSGQQSEVEVFSPVTGRTYRMSCTSASPHICTGGNDARVTFP